VLDGTFRGDLAPKDPAAWMAAYTGFVTHVADLGKQVGATALVVGTELTNLQSRTADWRSLIAQVRARFSGQLTYAANWVDGAEKVAFWDALDLIGVDAYMPIVKDDPDPTVPQLVAGWQPWRARLQKLNEQWGKPVLFTELGYPSRLGAAEHPSQEGSGAISQAAQARAYEAAFRAFDGTAWFHGIWWWDWPADGGDPVADAGGYTMNGKLAERTLTRWLIGAP
jgi:exo-beta-1,3-glucanase (GH17 family)